MKESDSSRVGFGAYPSIPTEAPDDDGARLR
jgi:hypothetical protein